MPSAVGVALDITKFAIFQLRTAQKSERRQRVDFLEERNALVMTCEKEKISTDSNRRG